MPDKDWEELAAKAAQGIDDGGDGDDWEAAAKQGLSGLSAWQPPSPPVERNIVGETAAALGRGVGRAIEYTGRGIEELGGESVGGALRSAGQSVQQEEILAPSEELKTGQAGMLRRTLAGAAESIPMSAVPLATGAAGAAVGGPIGALAGGAAGLGTLFYGGTYSAEKERALKEFEQLHPDWTPEQREQEASSFAHKQALWETGTEGVSDLVLMGIGRAVAKGVTREGIDGGRAVLRDLIGSGGPKQMAKKFAQVYAAEGGTEIAAYLGQAANEQTYGLGEGPTLTGTLDTALVSLWMTGAMGGAVGGLNYAARNKIVSDLNSENNLIRDRAAEKVEAKVAEKFGPESANQWRSLFESSVAEGKGGGFNIDSPLFGATAEAYAPEGGGVLDKALGATQPAATQPADTDAQFQAASRAAEEAAMEANPDYEAASVLAEEAAGEANAEAQFETESVAARKRAAGMPLNTEEQAALAAAEQRLARPAVAAPAPVVPRQDMQLPTQQAGTEARQAGAEAVETPEQAQQGYETYLPEPPVNPASEYGRQQAEFERIQKEAAEYNRLKNIPDKLPELPSDLRSIDSLSRSQLLDVAKKYGVKTVNDKTGKSIGVKAAVKRFADSELKRIAAETRLRTPEEQARLDQLAGRTPERMAEAARKAREASARAEYQQAAAELENAPLKPAPGGKARLARDIEQSRSDRAAAVQQVAAEQGEEMKRLDAIKDDALQKALELSAKKKELFGNVDITSPISLEEREIDRKLQSQWSIINQAVKAKNKLNRVSTKEVITDAQQTPNEINFPVGRSADVGLENIFTEEEFAATLPVMLRDLAQGTAGRRLRKAGESYGYDAESGEYIAEPSSYPEWVRRHPELSKAGRAAIERVAELGRTNGKMTERQIDLWTKLKQAASEEYSSNPEIQAGVDYERLRQQGFDFESQGTLLASDFKENDSFAVVENGRPVKMTAKGVDENTGDFIFEKEDGGIVRRGAFDEIEPVATKFQKEAMPEGEIPFSKTKAPLENAADVRTELAELYSPRLAKLAEKNGLVKMVDPATAERMVEQGIDPKRAADGRIEGFVSKDGQVHLVQGGIEKGQVGGIIAHELGTHAMRSGFTKEQAWADVLDHSDRLLAKGDKAVVEARRRAEEAGTPASLMREETVAYLSNIAPKHGIIRNLIAKLKQFMINKGLASKFFVSKLTAADLQSLAQGAAKAAIKGKAAPGWVKGVDARLSYAGEKAKTADIGRLSEAKVMQAKGIDNEEIRQKTGWFQGLDKKWRFEIDDSDAKFSYPTPHEIDKLLKSSYGIDLQDLMSHEALYNAYPELKDMQVKFRDSEVAYYTPSEYRGNFGYITIPSSAGKKHFRETLIHEVQHAIQGKYLENFATGGNPKYYMSQKDAAKYKKVIIFQSEIERIYGKKPVTRDEAVEAVDKTIKEYRKNDEEWFLPPKEIFDEYIENRVFRLRDLLKSEYNDIIDLIDTYGLNVGTEPRTGLDIYRRLAGEVEAEDVAMRLNLSREEKAALSPYELYLKKRYEKPISKDELIVKTESGESVSSRITPDLRMEAQNKKGEPVTRPLSQRNLAEQEDLASVKEAVEARTEELRSGLTEGDMLARKIEQEAQKRISPRKQAQVEKDLLKQVREFKKQHLQPEIQDMANEIFGAIDPAARRMTPAKETDLKATRAEIERLKVEGADIDPALEAKVARLDRRRIGDMLPGEAQALLDVAKEIAYVNKTKNKLLSVQRNRNAAEVSSGIAQAIKEKPSKRYLQAEQTGVKAERGKNPILELGRNLIGDPASTFKTIMLDLGRGSRQSEAYKLSEAVSKAQDTELRHRRELNKLMTDSMGDWQRLAESKAWNAEQEVNGRKLTSGEKVYLKYSLNDKNVSDSIEKLGYRKRLDTKATKMSRAEREAIQLNPDEQRVYDALADYFESTYNILNPAHVIMKGWRLFKHEFGKYLPKSVSKLTLNDELGSIIKSGSLDGTGVTIDRLGTLNEINLKDIFEVITRQRDIASKYAAYAPLVRDMNLIFRSPELRNTLQMDSGVERNGKSMVENYVDDILRDLQGSKAQSDSGIEKAVRALRTNAGGAILAFRATTPLMQTASYPMALTQVSAKNLLRGLKLRGGFEEAAQWNERTAARLEQGFDREMADNRNKRLVKIGMAAISYMDRATIGKLWNATKFQVAEETGLTGDELLRKAGERFNDVLDTQPNYTTADRSMTMRTQSEIAKMLTMFGSAKSSVLNEIKKGIIIGQNTGDWSHLSKASAGLAVSAVMMGAIGAAAGAAFGKDKDLTEETFSRAAGSIPGLDVLTSMFKGYGSSNAGIEAVSSAAEAFGRLTDLARKKATGETVEPEQFRRAALVVLNGLSTAAGVPTENIIDNLGAGKRLLLGKDPLEQVESQLRRLEDFDFEKRKARVTRGKQGLELRAALSKLRAEFAGLDQEKVAAARRLKLARKRIKEIDKELEREVPAALRSRREREREGIAERAVRF